jgi:ubiquinone/menaquinone biosynthesis C-methylase UbiE
MVHADHIDLLRPGVPLPGGTWADLGSGSGAFTLALAELIGPQGVIYSVDTDDRALADQARRMRSRFPETLVHYVSADFTRPLTLPALDGIVMANSLHFHRKKAPIVEALRGLLKPGGRLLLVEYNTDRGNAWVPCPITFEAWEALAGRCGFVGTRKIGTRPSRFLGEIYSAESTSPL